MTNLIKDSVSTNLLSFCKYAITKVFKILEENIRKTCHLGEE